MSYSIALEGFEATYPEVERLYRMHYGEMKARLESEGIPIGDYNPRLDEYATASRGGWLLTFILRHEGKAVGYSNVYLTNDMHNDELIAQEDTIYVEPSHRNGIGRKLTKAVLAELEARGCKRISITAVTDTRVGPIWKRMGFKPAAEMMTYVFEVNNDVRAKSSHAA